MITALFKKICMVSLVTVLCVVQVKAEEILLKDAEFRRLPLGGCDPAFAQFRACIEGIINDRLDTIECELEKEFRDRNEFLSNRLCSLVIRLKEFITCQQKARDAALEEFFACNLDRVETNVEEFIVNKIDCILSLLCQRFADLDADINQVLCRIESGIGSIICLETTLLDFIGILNFDGDPETNPFFGAFNEFLDDFCTPILRIPVEPCPDTPCGTC